MPGKARPKHAPDASSGKPQDDEAKLTTTPEAAPHDDLDVGAFLEVLNEPLNEPPEDKLEPALIPTGEWSHGYVRRSDEDENPWDQQRREWRGRDARSEAGKETPEDIKRQRQDDNLEAYAAALNERRRKNRERAAAWRMEIANEERATYGLPPLEDVKEATVPKADSKEQPWADDAPEYLPLKEARKLIDDRVSLPALSKLMTPDGEMRHMRKRGCGCKVHLADFRRYMQGRQSDPKWAKAYLDFREAVGKGDRRWFWQCKTCGHEYPENAKAPERCPKCKGESNLMPKAPPKPRK